MEHVPYAGTVLSGFCVLPRLILATTPWGVTITPTLQMSKLTWAVWLQVPFSSLHAALPLLIPTMPFTELGMEQVLRKCPLHRNKDPLESDGVISTDLGCYFKNWLMVSAGASSPPG